MGKIAKSYNHSFEAQTKEKNTFSERKITMVDCSLVDWNLIVAELRQWRDLRESYLLM
jgi:hypothetical protein